ncbi:MAG: CpsD/CapB family tyrosine-protein kinase [Bryobacteraceae bacterium]
MSRLFDLMRQSGSPPDSGELPGTLVECAEIVPECRLVFHTDPCSPSADRYRLLRMRLRELGSSGKLKTVLITSPLPNDGKSTVCLNLATALAEGGNKNVLVMEADLHQPALTGRLGLEAWSGLAECLEDTVDPQSAIRRIDPLNWYLLPAGGSRANASELLQTAALSRVMSRILPHFDWILVDSPPVLPLSDATSLTRHADATLLVARAGRTAREAIEETISIIGRPRIVGMVLNGTSSSDRPYSKYYGSYYSGKSTRAHERTS